MIQLGSNSNNVHAFLCSFCCLFLFFAKKNEKETGILFFRFSVIYTTGKWNQIKLLCQSNQLMNWWIYIQNRFISCDVRWHKIRWTIANESNVLRTFTNAIRLCVCVTFFIISKDDIPIITGMNGQNCLSFVHRSTCQPFRIKLVAHGHCVLRPTIQVHMYC